MVNSNKQRVARQKDSRCSEKSRMCVFPNSSYWLSLGFDLSVRVGFIWSLSGWTSDGIHVSDQGFLKDSKTGLLLQQVIAAWPAEQSPGPHSSIYHCLKNIS